MCTLSGDALTKAFGLPTDSDDSSKDQYKNPGSGSATPQWKLGVNLNYTASPQPSHQGSSSSTSSDGGQRSELSG